MDFAGCYSHMYRLSLWLLCITYNNKSLTKPELKPLSIMARFVEVTAWKIVQIVACKIVQIVAWKIVQIAACKIRRDKKIVFAKEKEFMLLLVKETSHNCGCLSGQICGSVSSLFIAVFIRLFEFSVDICINQVPPIQRKEFLELFPKSAVHEAVYERVNTA